MFRSGNANGALAMANGVLETDPFSADALLIRAMVRISQGDIKNAIPDMRVLADLRSGDWLFDRLHYELMSRTRVNLKLDDAMKLGAFLRARISPLGPPAAKERRRAGHTFINVLGTSFVRSFGGQTCFLPIFVGMGPDMLFLTDAAAAATSRRVLENLKRLDLTRPTVLSIGSDAYYHITNILKLRRSETAPLEDADFAIMEQVAARHLPMLEAAKKLSKGPILLLCSTPTQDDRMNKLSRHLNKHLAEVCAKAGVGFLDWWQDLADPVTDRLADRYCANAYPGDIHFSLETTTVFVRKLKEIGLFDKDYEEKTNYEWSHVFECDVGVGDKTRIWCEPSVTPANAVKSHKIAATHIYGKVADFLTAMGIASGPQTALYVNVREGYLPTAFPAAVVSRSVALTSSAKDADMARAVLDFWGRSDVVVRDDRQGTLAGFTPSLLVGATYPTSMDADIDALNSALRHHPAVPTVAILLIEPSQVQWLKLPGYALRAQMLIGHRFVPEAWQRATLFLFQAAAEQPKPTLN
jgi:hypothetical protein